MSSARRRAKIVATLGPASSDLATVEKLIKAGVNVFRFNFSHGTHADHKKRFDIVREASKKLGMPVALLQDLQGPKLRVGEFDGGIIEIAAGEEVVFYLETKKVKTAKSGVKLIPYNYEKLAKEISVGHRILMDDGNLEVKVEKIEADKITAKVVFGGKLKDHKGMNFPDTSLSIQSFTPKDQEDLAFGLEVGFDYVALSFVRTPDDIEQIKKYMEKAKKPTPVVAKIEKGEAIKNLSEILAVTDAVMVARGDLAVEVGTAQVPTLQKKIIAECRSRGIPVITATQMLESMIYTPRPTRAEASDVANAVLDGTDAVMLSAETASGQFPVLTVETMHSIILETESHWKGAKGEVREHSTPSLVDAIEHAAARLAVEVGAKAIACTTHTGQAARALARYRPRVPIIAFTDTSSVRRKLALIWGVESVQIEPTSELEKLFNYAEMELARLRYVKKGDLVVFTAGWPPLQHGTTHLLKVVPVRSDYKL